MQNAKEVWPFNGHFVVAKFNSSQYEWKGQTINFKSDQVGNINKKINEYLAIKFKEFPLSLVCNG